MKVLRGHRSRQAQDRLTASTAWQGLGDSNTAVTSDIYQHVTPEMDAAVAARVAGISLDG